MRKTVSVWRVIHLALGEPGKETKADIGALGLVGMR